MAGVVDGVAESELETVDGCVMKALVLEAESEAGGLQTRGVWRLGLI
jgi:hypothetical protein